MSNNNNGKTGSGQSSMTKSDASRVQSTQATGGGNMSSTGFAARAQAAGDKNANAAQGGVQTGGMGNAGK
ncbi:uncharacterized protein BKCO1_4600074 [Diplodia corticola]|uniref:SMP domain-containing protein n=1 Tax=Diplodia corticola TaxID=236234 RepID=A0A1J9RVY1_9PEZI|nr:uncharacterized protein BKCO1_4600074 [Diplodia corticola]OJD31645.1 hypothetical protein BKCO1_4600074 [Diplodia corticola]